jgi:hypothetical protein
MLDRFLGREARVMLSAFGLPSANIDPRGGWWREGCTPETQASWAGRVVSVSLSKPFIEATMWADAADGDPASNGFGLVTQAGTAQPVVAKLAGIRRTLRAPLGPRKSDGDGVDARGGELPSKSERERGRGLHD